MLPSQSNKALHLAHLAHTSLLKCLHFRSSRPELFCKKDVLKNFAKFTDVSSGTRVPCELCDILKYTFFRRTPPVAASGICANRDFLF